MVAYELGVGVGHLRFEPEPEIHPSGTDVLHYRAESFWPDCPGDEPVTEAGAIIAARAEPAVVDDEAFDTDPRGDVGESGQPLEGVVEVHRLPRVENDRTRPSRMVRPPAQHRCLLYT